MIKLSIKNRFTGSIIFEYEKENNTIKETLVEAINQDADLQGANLRDADLRGAYLQGANLQDADLQDADLQGANLQDADLQGANLRDADLRGAYLRGANLQGEKISKAVVFTGLYVYVVIPYITKEGVKRVKMGCHNRTLEEWNSDFWNNPNEFPNDNSEKSNMRVMAFETAKKWFEIVK